MSNIDKQANQVSRYDLVSGYMQKWPDGEFVYHSDYQALLDELEAAQKTSAARLGAIDTTHKMFQRERDRAEKAEKRIAEYQELISGLVGVSSSILREVERINKAAAAGKGDK